MQLSMLIVTLFAAVTMASPGAVSLKRSFKDVPTPVENDPSRTVQIACVECPCDGFEGNCQCIFQGCCCDWTVLPLPPADTWRARPRGV